MNQDTRASAGRRSRFETALASAFALLCTTPNPSPAAASFARPTAVSDHLRFAEDRALEIEESDLRANDTGAAGQRLEIVDWPLYGELKVVYGASRSRLTYRARSSRAGRESGSFGDRFTYRWIGPAGPSNLAAVTLSPIGNRLYFAGQWERLPCTDPTCPEPGTDHLGWFDGENQEVVTCQIRCDCSNGACVMRDCVIYPAPAGSVDWTPLASDWDGDGWDDLGLFDPSTGIVRRYLLPDESCSSTWAGCQLQEILPWPALLVGVEPVAGVWRPGTPSSLGFYSPHFLSFTLLPSGHEPFEFALGEGGDSLPVAEDWNLDGRDTVGLVNFDKGTLFYVDDHDSTPRYTVDIGFGHSRQAFTGRWNGNPFLGLRGRGGVSFYGIRNQAEPHKGSIYLSIPEDPGKGCPEDP